MPKKNTGESQPVFVPKEAHAPIFQALDLAIAGSSSQVDSEAQAAQKEAEALKLEIAILGHSAGEFVYQ